MSFRFTQFVFNNQMVLYLASFYRNSLSVALIYFPSYFIKKSILMLFHSILSGFYSSISFDPTSFLFLLFYANAFHVLFFIVFILLSLAFLYFVIERHLASFQFVSICFGLFWLNLFYSMKSKNSTTNLVFWKTSIHQKCFTPQEIKNLLQI